MTLHRLTELTRERWETGAHGDKHLRMSKALMDRLRAHWPAEPKPWGPTPLGDIMSIPIVSDESVGGGLRWELRDNVSRRCLESGYVLEIEFTPIAEGVDHV